MTRPGIRKIAAAALFAALALALTSSGQIENAAAVPTPPAETLVPSASYRVVCSFGPVYSVVEAVARHAEGTAVSVLAQRQDMCLRSYPLSDWDVYALLSSADAFVICGGGLESFSSIISQLPQYGIAACALLDTDTAAEETDQEEKDHFSGPEAYAYMTFDGVGGMLESACEALKLLDPANAGSYDRGLEEALKALEERRMSFPELKGKKVCVMTEAALALADDMGLNAVVFRREPCEEADPDDIKELAARLGESGTRVVLIEKQAPASLLRMLEECGLAVVKLDILGTHAGTLEEMLDKVRGNMLLIKGAFDVE